MKNSDNQIKKHPKPFTPAECKLIHTLRDYYSTYNNYSDDKTLTYNKFIGSVIEYYLELINNGNDYGQYNNHQSDFNGCGEDSTNTSTM